MYGNKQGIFLVHNLFLRIVNNESVFEWCQMSKETSCIQTSHNKQKELQVWHLHFASSVNELSTKDAIHQKSRNVLV